MALFAGLGRLLLEADDQAPGTVVDREFIAEHCANFDAYEAQTRAVDLDTVLEATGIDRSQLDRLAQMLIASDTTIACWAMGLTQHRHAVPMISELTNLLLMRGMIGKPGAGVCPVRGHSNVQGDRTMGIWEKMPETFLAALDSEFGIVSPRKHGMDTVDAIRAMRDGHASVFMGMGGNFAMATPDTDGHRGRAAQLLAHRAGVDEAEPQPRRTRHHGADPAVARAHRQGLCSRASNSKSPLRIRCPWCTCPAAACNRPANRCAAKSAIVSELARAVLGPDHPVPWEAFQADYDRVRDAIAAVVPGCADYNRKVRQPDGFQLPHPPRDSREFPTTTGKANFAVNPLEWIPVPEGRLILQTLRSHDQYNTTIYGLDDRYRGVKGGRRVIFVNPADVASLGFTDGDRVDLVSEYTTAAGNLEERRAEDFLIVPYSTPVGNAAAYYPETNSLVALDHVAARSNTPVSKAVLIRLEARQWVGSPPAVGPATSPPTARPPGPRRSPSKSRWRSASTAPRSA